MKFESFKGTLYDFFGYFSPGMLLLITWLIAFSHGKGIVDLYPIVKKYIGSSTTTEIILVVFISYILGHAIASTSSFIIEKNVLCRIKSINDTLCIKSILPPELYTAFEVKFRNLFNTDFKEEMFRTVMCYVQTKHKAIYDTAFVFLSFYGMARNFTLIFGSAFLWEMYNRVVLKLTGTGWLIMLYFVLMILFGYEYYRFTKYYKDQIANGFLIP